MLTKIIDPETSVVVRIALDAAELEECLLKIQDGGDPAVIKLGDGENMLYVIPC